MIHTIAMDLFVPTVVAFLLLRIFGLNTGELDIIMESGVTSSSKNKWRGTGTAHLQ